METLIPSKLSKVGQRMWTNLTAIVVATRTTLPSRNLARAQITIPIFPVQLKINKIKAKQGMAPKEERIIRYRRRIPT